MTDLGFRHPCSDFMDMLRRLISRRIIIIIIISTKADAGNCSGSVDTVGC